MNDPTIFAFAWQLSVPGGTRLDGDITAIDTVTGEVVLHLENGSTTDAEININAPDGHPLRVIAPTHGVDQVLPGNSNTVRH